MGEGRRQQAMNNYLPSGSGLSAPGCPSKADVAALLTMRNFFSTEQAVSLSFVCLIAGGHSDWNHINFSILI